MDSIKESRIKQFWKYKIRGKTRRPDLYTEYYEEQGFKIVLWLNKKDQSCFLLYATAGQSLRGRIADILEKPWGKRPRRLLQPMLMELGYSGTQREEKFLILSDNAKVTNSVLGSSEIITIKNLGYKIEVRSFIK